MLFSESCLCRISMMSLERFLCTYLYDVLAVPLENRVDYVNIYGFTFVPLVSANTSVSETSVTYSYRINNVLSQRAYRHYTYTTCHS